MLRFYDLGGNSIWLDEAVAANNARGTFWEAVQNTRHSNSSPILYPLVLWMVQKVESSAFTVRMVPAAASLATVAALLFLMPRVGVSRWAAFTAGLLATVSAEAIRHAQDAREYSIDALVAVLMTAGMISHLQRRKMGGGTNVLLCASLFVAPLVQYGLVLFGIAVLGTIAIVEAVDTWRCRATLRESWDRSKLRSMAWPAASFTAGCAISGVATVRYQYQTGGFGADSYLASGYYSGGYGDVLSILEFVLPRTWQLFVTHLPKVLALDFIPAFRTMPDTYVPEVFVIFAFAGLGAFIVASIRRARLDTITILFMLSTTILICAAMLRIYPYVGRHALHLTPVIFLTLGSMIHWMTSDWAWARRREWLSNGGMALLAGLIILGGVIAIRDREPYLEYENLNSVLSALEERERQGDVVYVSRGAHAAMRFYRGQKPSNHWYGDCRYLATIEECVGDILEAQTLPTNRLWVVFSHWKGADLELLEELLDGIRVEHVVDADLSDLYLLEAPNLLDLLSRPLGSLEEEGGLIINSDFDVYLSGDRLTYVREPCSPEDVEERFFLHIVPADARDIPADSRRYGYHNLDFHLQSFGTMSDEKCVAVRGLPAYGIDRISTGQFTWRQGRSWEAEYRFDE